ncbi:spore coat protein [Neobacillus sp. LXY-4]|uniref:spore coat protein n=1 Tax=Neobacillus sp. LXY-4 TaxID=3379826 RepID=UPI003EE37F33
MKHQLGAHEVLELHEILSHSINGIHMFHLYEPYIRDQELRSILENQLHFMMDEYNQLASNPQLHHLFREYPASSEFEPRYGLDSPPQFYPKVSNRQLTDQDIASGILGWHKTAAIKKMTAALECADFSLRQAFIQGANNCADQAFELFQYMNIKGYYQVPKLTNQDDVIHQFQEAPDPALFNIQYQ